MAPPRVLLCGDVLGRLNQLVKRVQSVNKSAGPFDALFCVGQFFPDSPERLDEFMEYVEGKAQFPLPTYFTGDYGVGAPKVLLAASRNSANLGFKMDGFKICENLFWLKGSGKFNLHGLSIAYLSGRQALEAQPFGTYSQDDVDALRALVEEPGIVDLFLTNEWPSAVTNRASASNVPAGFSDSSGLDSIICELVAEIKPRYHIAGTKGVFYAREPYSNVDAVHVTRFLGLASVGNKDKQKFLHALSPTPSSAMSAAEISMKPPNTTLSPYTLAGQADSSRDDLKRNTDDTGSDSQYWRYDVSQKRKRNADENGDRICFKFVFSGSCPRGEKCHFHHDADARDQFMRGVCIDFIIKGKCERGSDCTFKHNLLGDGESHSHRRPGPGSAHTGRSKECWFCLSSPNIESHLITSIGESCYCALPKGPLAQDHVLIVPIEHLPNTLSLPPECEIELVKFKDCLQMYHKNKKQEAVFFEWVSKRVSHANLQVIPVPSSKVPALKDIFSLAAEKLGFKFMINKFNDNLEARKWMRKQFDDASSCFYVELPEGTILWHLVGEDENFPVQFGREVLAGLLNLPDKADWKNCKLSKEEETELAENFKKKFEMFDPNH